MASDGKMKIATDQRKFTIVYNDFLESDKLDNYEKLIFIAIKKFADSNLQAFPSYNTLSKITGISARKIKRCVAHMIELKVLSVEHRDDEAHGHRSNLYTLYDFGYMWGEDKAEAEKIIPYTSQELIAELKRRGDLPESKELVHSDQEKTQAHNASTNSVTKDYSTESLQNQEERYSLDDIKMLYSYDILCEGKDEGTIDQIDLLLQVLYDALNTKKSTIRINQEDKPTMVVIGVLTKLYYGHLLTVLEEFGKQTGKIKNPKAYLLTMLYNSGVNMSFGIQNQVQVDRDKFI